MRRYSSALFVVFLLTFTAALINGPVGAQQPVKVVDATGTDVPVATTTEAAHNGALGTLTAVKALLTMCRAYAAVPSAVGANDNAVLGWCNLVGARASFPVANAAGGADSCYVASTVSTNAFNCKTTAGTLYDFSAINVTATIYYVRLYNLGAAPTCSSSTGYLESIPIPASTTGAGIVRTYPVGRNYGTGIGGCITSGPGSTDTGTAAVGVYVSLGVK